MRAIKYGIRRKFIFLTILAFRNSDTPAIIRMLSHRLRGKALFIKIVDKLKKIQIKLLGRFVRFFIPMPILDEILQFPIFFIAHNLASFHQVPIE